MGAVRNPRDVVEEDEAVSLAEGELKGGNWDDREGAGLPLLSSPAVSRGAPDDEWRVREAGVSCCGWWEGLREVDFAAVVDVHDASAKDPHLGGDVDGSDYGRRVPEDVHVLSPRPKHSLECTIIPALHLGGEAYHHCNVSSRGCLSSVLKSAVSRRAEVEGNCHFQASVVGQFGEGYCHGRHVEDGLDRIVFLLDPLSGERSSQLGLDLLPKVGWEVVGICPAFQPLAAARADHVAPAPVVDEDHGSEAVSARQGEFRVVWLVLEEMASGEKG